MRTVGWVLLLAVLMGLPLAACTGAPDSGTDSRSSGTVHAEDSAKPPDSDAPKAAGDVGDGGDGGDGGDAGDAEDAGRVAFQTVASQKTLPQEFDRLAWKREQVPYFQYLVRKADQAAQYEAAWKWFRLEGDRPAVDFAQDTVWFIALRHESGTCPMTLADMRADAARRELRVSVAITAGKGNETPDGAGIIGCTADATPRTFVFTIAKDAVRDVERVVIVENVTETEIPVDA